MEQIQNILNQIKASIEQYEMGATTEQECFNWISIKVVETLNNPEFKAE